MESFRILRYFSYLVLSINLSASFDSATIVTPLCISSPLCFYKPHSLLAFATQERLVFAFKCWRRVFSYFIGCKAFSCVTSQMTP